MNPQDITLTIATLSGNVTDKFNIHQSLQHVVDLVVAKLKLQLGPNEVWVLFLGSTQLNLSQTIAEAGIPDGATLKLAPREKGGGGSRD